MNELIAAAIWIIVWVALIGLTLIALGINRPSKQDDDEQAEAVTQPAPLRPHVSSRNYWSKS